MSTPYPAIPSYGPGGLWRKKNKAEEAPEVSYDGDQKPEPEHLSETSIDPTTNEPSTRRRHEAPPLVRDLAPEERARLEKKLVQKIDLRLLPMLIIMYLMNYLDRNNIAAARLAGLEDDLGLTGTQYLTAVSILFVGYILMQVPSNLFLNKIGKPSIYLPICMVVWGVISAATAAAQSFGGLIAVRFFLGFVEAAYFPGCLFFLSLWYTRKELGFRTAILYSGSLMSGAFSGLITAGITGNLDGKRGLRAWRWLFIIEGVVTIFIAFIAILILPDFPRTTKWLTENERQLAVWRLDEDIGEDDWTGAQNQTFWHGMKLAFSDLKMWVLVGVVVPYLQPAGLLHESKETDHELDGARLLLRRLGHSHQPLPNRRQNPWLQQHRFTSVDCPTIHSWCHYDILQFLACGQNGREILPHHYPALLRSHRIHHCCRYNEDRSQISGDDVDDTRGLYGVCGCVGMDQ